MNPGPHHCPVTNTATISSFQRAFSCSKRFATEATKSLSSRPATTLAAPGAGTATPEPGLTLRCPSTSSRGQKSGRRGTGGATTQHTRTFAHILTTSTRSSASRRTVPLTQSSWAASLTHSKANGPSKPRTGGSPRPKPSFSAPAL